MSEWGYIELDNIFSNWNEPSVHLETCNLVSLKKSGYEFNYENVLPMDAIDFICRHFVVWIKEGSDKKFVAAFRSVDLVTIERYKLDSPSNSLLRSIGEVADTSRHIRYLNQLRLLKHEEKSSVVFFNGWTIHPDYRRGHPQAAFIKRASLAPLYFSLQDKAHHRAIASGMPHLKSDQVLTSVGFKPWLDQQGQEIPAIASPAFGGKETLFMDCLEFNHSFIQEIKFLQNAWNERTILRSPVKVKKAA